MKPGVRIIGGVAASAVALALGVLAAWPIYRSGWLWLVALVALVDTTLAVDEQAPCLDASCTVPGCCETGATV